jgi:hypothetical protein
MLGAKRGLEIQESQFFNQRKLAAIAMRTPTARVATEARRSQMRLAGAIRLKTAGAR